MSEGLDGCFPRLNASLLRQGSFSDCLASFVGKIESHDTFRCCDGGTITLTDVAFDMDEVEKDMVVEIMGQTIDQNTVQVRPSLILKNASWLAVANGIISSNPPCFVSVIALSLSQPFIARPLSKDTDLALYNKMIEIQHNPKYAQFFTQQH